jgi:hypothetical protein
MDDQNQVLLDYFVNVTCYQPNDSINVNELLTQRQPINKSPMLLFVLPHLLHLQILAIET